MLSHLPVAFLVDSIPARYISSLIDVDEMAIAYLSDARSNSTTVWDLFEEFSDELPEKKLTKRGRPTKKAERVIARWARRAAEEFGLLMRRVGQF